MYQRILIPVDGSPTSERAIEEAVQFAHQQGAQVEVIMIIEDLLYFEDNDGVNYAALLDIVKCNNEKILAAAEQKFQQAGIAVVSKLLEAKGERIANTIVTEAKSFQADLIIIGTHGRSGFSRMVLGSVAEAVLRMAHIPILLIRGG